MIPKIIEFYNKLSYCRLKKKELKYELDTKQKVSKIRKLSKDNHSLYKKFWGKVKIEEKWVAYYNQFHSSFDPRMISDQVFFSFIDPYFNNLKVAQTVDDKNLYDLLFYDVQRPNTILRKISGVLYDNEYKVVSESIKDYFSKDKLYIIKPAIYTAGSFGIKFWTYSDGLERLSIILDNFSNAVVQEVLEQHQELSALHKDSLNTLRIMTLNYNGKVIPLSSVVRMGIGGNRVDNVSSGGLFCGVNENGRLKDVAYDDYGTIFKTHPQGAVFSEHFIPNYEECVNMVTMLAPRLDRFSKLLSWDLAIDKNGHPVLIEVNMCYSGYDMLQIANGPIFGDLTKEILDKVFQGKINRVLNFFYR